MLFFGVVLYSNSSSRNKNNNVSNKNWNGDVDDIDDYHCCSWMQRSTGKPLEIAEGGVTGRVPVLIANYSV